MLNRLEQMLMGIKQHPALDNQFYAEWMSRAMTIEELEIVARNYGAWVRSFPDALAILIAATADLDAKTEYVKTLYSEMGYGNPSKAHSALLDGFFEQLGSRMGFESRLTRDCLEGRVELTRSTVCLIEGEQKLYRDARRSLGAQLALEWQAYTMLRKLYEGATNYRSLWPDPDEFHEACEYFYTHIGAAEKDHKDESLNAVKRYAVSEESVSGIVEGYDRHLELISDFWNGLYNATTELAARSSASRLRAQGTNG